MKEYMEYAVEKTVELLQIDSPTGYTENATKWVIEQFESLGFSARYTVKGGVGCPSRRGWPAVSFPLWYMR